MSSDDILIVKKGKKDNQLSVKVTKRKFNSYSSPQYQKVLNVKDSSDIAILLSDLDILFDAPVENGIKKYKKDRNPFW